MADEPRSEGQDDPAHRAGGTSGANAPGKESSLRKRVDRKKKIYGKQRTSLVPILIGVVVVVLLALALFFGLGTGSAPPAPAAEKKGEQPAEAVEKPTAPHATPDDEPDATPDDAAGASHEAAPEAPAVIPDAAADLTAAKPAAETEAAPSMSEVDEDAAGVKVAKAGDGYNVDAPGYKATIAPSGMLASLQVKGTEILGKGLDFPRDGQTSVQSAEVLTSPLPSVRLELVARQGPVEMTYTFTRERIRARMAHSLGQWQNYSLSFNTEKTLAFEDLQNRGTTGVGEAISYVTSGPRRAAPVERLSRMQMFRAIFPDVSVRVWHDTWGAPFNIDEIGSVNGYDWSRNLLQGNNPMTINFVIEPPGETGRAAGPVFTPESGRFNNLFYEDEPVTWKLNVKKDTLSRVPAGAKVAASWEVRDFWGRVAAKGSEVLSAADLAGSPEVTIEPEARGYFDVTFTLSVPGTKLVPSDFYTRFAVIGRSAGLAERPEPGANLPREYGQAALMGMKCVRMSHNMRNYFPDPNTEKWNELDEIFNTSSAESKRWGIAWFFQANSRPDWADPARYEEVAFKVVSRYKDRCKVWEVENEPNFGYSPADYITKCLVPFAKGAKRADPDCIVMGPDGVSVPNTLRFLEEIYRQGANRYLDAVSTHTYHGPGESWEQFGNLRYLARVRELMSEHGDKAKLLWQTEQGYTWGHEPKVRQARYVTRQYLGGYLRGIPNERQYYFYPVHNGFEPWYLVESGSSHGMNGTWFPAAAAVRAMAEALDGAQFVREEPTPHEGVFAARFTARDREVFALWTLDFPLECELYAKGAKELRDIMGNSRRASERLKLTLSGEPQYLVAAKGAQFRFLAPYFGKNLASATAGAVYSASSSRSDCPPSNAGDGRWSLRDGAEGMPPARTYWCPARPLPLEGGGEHWLEVRLPVARPVSRVLIMTCLPAVEPNPRDYRLLVRAKGEWQEVAKVTDSETWTIHHEFPTVEADGLRLVVMKINDGWHMDGRWMHVIGEKFLRYTDCLEKICDVQLFGPEPTVEASAAIDPEKTFRPEAVTLTVSAKANRGSFKGKVLPSVPEGWKASPAEAALSLAGKGAAAKATFRLSPPERLEAGAVALGAAVRAADGSFADAAGVALEVASPVELAALAPPRVDAAAQPFSAKLKNVSPARASGTLTVAATVDGVTKRAEAPFDLAPAEERTVELAVAGVDIAGRPAEVEFLARCSSGVDARARQSLMVLPYSFIGPFSNADKKGFAEEFGPEKDLDLAKGHPGEGGRAEWRKGATDPSGYFDFTKVGFRKGDWVTAYAVTFVKSPEEQKAKVSAGSDDGIKVWVNGSLVIANDAYRGAAPGQEEAAVSLKKGWNPVLLKITQGGGGWGFYMSVLDAKGAPLAGLEYADSPGKE